MLAGDLVARVRWLGEHDRAALVELLASIDPAALRLALRLAEPRSAAPMEPGSAHSAGTGDLSAAD